MKCFHCSRGRSSIKSELVADPSINKFQFHPSFSLHDIPTWYPLLEKRNNNRFTGVLTGSLSLDNAYGSGNHLTIQRSQLTASEKPENDEFGHSFVCRTCPYEFVVDKEYYNRRMSRVKKVDDVMGGAAAWQNVDQTIGTLPDSLSPGSMDRSCGILLLFELGVELI